MTEPQTKANSIGSLGNDHIPAVSVGMPVYNGAKYIREALDSLLAQTFTDFELVISDNASTDETQKICSEYVGKDRRIKYVCQADNLGSSGNFNYLLAHAKGVYFTWLACDDFMEPTYLEKMVQHLDQFEDVTVCACDFKVVDDKGGVIRIEHLEAIYPSSDWSHSQEHFFMFPLTNVYFAIYGMYRRREIENSGIKTKTTWLGLTSGIETPFLCRVAAIGKIVAIPEILRAYRNHPQSVYNTEKKRKKSALRRLNHLLLRVDQLYVAVIHPIPFVRKLRLFSKMIMFTINDFLRAFKKRLR